MKIADPSRLGEARGTALRLLERARRRIDSFFANREILLRSSDRVRCIRLTPRFQKASALLLAIGVGWGTYASIGFLEQRSELADRDLEIERSQAAYGDLLAEVDRYQRQFASITSDLESAQRRLLAQLDSEGLAEPPEQAAGRSDRAAEMRARMVVAQGELRLQLEALEKDLKDVARRNGSLKDHVQNLQSALAATENERAEVAEAHSRLGRTLDEMELALAHERADKARLEDEIASWKSRHAALVEARGSLIEERDLLAGDLAAERSARAQADERAETLQASIAVWRDRHGALLELRDAMVAERSRMKESLQSEQQAKAALERQLGELKTRLAAAQDQVVRAATEREGLDGELAVLRDQLKQALFDRDGLERKLVEERERLGKSRDRVAALEQRRGELETGTVRLARALRGSEQEKSALADRVDELEEALGRADARIADLRQERDQQRRRLAELNGGLSDSRERVAALEGQLYSLGRTLDTADRKTEALAEQRDVLRARLVEARGQLARQAEHHDAVIQSLSNRTKQSIDTMEELLSLTGLDIEAVVDEASSRVEGDGKGGPFVPYVDAPEKSEDGDPAAVLGLLDDEIRRWEALQLVLASTPLASPLAGEFRVSSPFGKRKDPMNGRLARHEGMDMVAAYRSPVLATAPGVVAFAGWMSGYGRIVEIDHGFGITTRYAHLRRIDVKVGEQVGFHEQIGQLGNSGRSTGAHVHYEVRYDDKPLDPLKFMKAANHVLKG